VTDIPMPRLSDSMEEGTILRWLVSDGADVRVGDEIVEIETDKATMTYEADAAGIVQILAEAGDTVTVGHPIGRFAGAAGSTPPPGAPTNGATRVKASPLARRVAAELGVVLAEVTGTGPQGRIVRADVERARATTPVAALEPTVPIAETARPTPAAARTERVELSRMQQTIARRMSDAKATMPDFQVHIDADVTELLELRRTLKDAGLTASVNDFVVRACALALLDHPRVNGRYQDGTFELHRQINVGVAVAVDNGLIVPVISHADTKPVTVIAAETRVLAQRARDGSIAADGLASGTFTISNLGMFGVTSFTAVINPGQAAILAVGAAIERPTVRGGEIVPRSVLDLSLSSDHRIIYGADAARFLADVRRLLEAPMHLLS
jgi:pyruvate dehydrogenase E2 component (dihydrolipoamide acetyltransferase)